MIHRLRGRPSNRKFAVSFQRKVLARVGQRYADFGPTLAAEHLAQEGLALSRETLRNWMTQAAFWRPRRQRVKKIHVWRERRASFGELVMQDSSPFRWLEDRGPACQLIAVIDDATSRIHAQFVEHDTTEENLRTLGGWLRQAGAKPLVSRFPAQELETLVISQILLLLRSPDKCTANLENSPEKDVAAERAKNMAKRWPRFEISKQHGFVRKIVRRVVVGQSTVWIEIDEKRLLETLLGHKPVFDAAVDGHVPGIIKLSAKFKPVHKGSELRLVAPNGSCSDGTPVPSLVKAIVRARDWYERIVAGEVGTITAGHDWKAAVFQQIQIEREPSRNLEPQTHVRFGGGEPGGCVSLSA